LSEFDEGEVPLAALGAVIEVNGDLGEKLADVLAL
jgi:hypothetical protein